MKKLLLCLLFTFGLNAVAQTKKAALVSIYIENEIQMRNPGGIHQPVTDIEGTFTPDLQPLVRQFRDSLFRYFPVQGYTLIPEAQLTAHPGYKAYKPRYYNGFSPTGCTTLPGYKVIYYDDNDMASQQLGRLLPKLDAMLYVEITFTMTKAENADDLPKINARAYISMLDKTGKMVWGSSFSVVEEIDATDADPYAPKAVFGVCKKAIEGLTSLMKDGI